MRDIRIKWREVPDFGRQPHVIFTRAKSTSYNYPDEKTDMEIRFFGYEFDKSKIPLQLLDKANFNTASINRDFNVGEIELLLEKDKKSDTANK